MTTEPRWLLVDRLAKMDRYAIRIGERWVVGYNGRGGVRTSKHRHRAETSPIKAVAEEVAARLGGVAVNIGPRVV